MFGQLLPISVFKLEKHFLKHGLFTDMFTRITTESRMMFKMSEVQLCQKKPCVATVEYFLPTKRIDSAAIKQENTKVIFVSLGAGSVCPSNMWHAFQRCVRER